MNILDRNSHWEDLDEEFEGWDIDPTDTKELFEPTNDDEYSFEGDEDFDDAVLDIDYSEFRGTTKDNLNNIKHSIRKAPKKKRKPLSKTFDVKNKSTTFIHGKGKQIGRVLIPNDRPVTVQGVDHFILSAEHDTEKGVGYYKGKKLKELILQINNTTGVDFDLELFNPSMPLDFLQSTSANLNDRVVVSGSTKVSYTDILFNFLANPTLIPGARFIATGTNVEGQKRQVLSFVNKAVDGESRVNPLSLSLNLDVYQQQSDVILFDIMGQLNRAFIPDGMDVIQYKVLAGNTVTFCFYYKQRSLKKLMYKEARKKSMILDEMKELL